MAVLGSNIMIDLHITPDTDVEAVRGAVASQGRLRSDLAGEVEQTITRTAEGILEEQEVEPVGLSVDLRLVDDRVPGAPRERITAQLNVEGEESVLAAVDDALGTPARARIADATEGAVRSRLEEADLAEAVETRVIATPVQFH